MCDFGPGAASAVNLFARDTIMDSIIGSLMSRGVDLETQLGSNPFSTPAEIIDHLASRPDVIATLENQLPSAALPARPRTLLTPSEPSFTIRAALSSFGPHAP